MGIKNVLMFVFLVICLVGTASAAVDDSNTKILLHMDGSNAGTTFTDESGKIWTAGGNGQLSTNSPKFGTASGLFNNSSWITTPDSTDLTVGSGDFTIDFWVKRSTLGTTSFIFGSQNSAAQDETPYTIVFLPDNTVQAYFGTGSTYHIATSISTINDTTTSHHLAMVRSGANGYLFIDGVLSASVTTLGATVLRDCPGSLSIGRPGAYNGLYFNGSIDEFRLSKVARWTANFTVPSSAYVPYTPPDEHGNGTLLTSDSYTQSLIHFNDGDGSTAFTDSKGIKSWTAENGSTEVTTQTYQGTSAVYFNGNQYIHTTSTGMVPGTNDFTIDFAMKLTSLGSYQFIMGDTPANGASAHCSVQVYADTNNKMNLILADGSTNSLTTATTAIPNTNWHNYSLQRKGSVVNILQDGAVVATDNSVTLNASGGAGNQFSIGCSGLMTTACMTGYIDEFRYSIGIARYTPPAWVYYAIGDSVTAAWGAADLPSDGTKCYILQMAQTHDPANYSLTSHSMDGGGMEASWGIANWATHYRPGTKYVFIEFGLNDLAHNIPASTCVNNIITMHNWAQDNGTVAIPIIQSLMTYRGDAYEVLTTQRAYIAAVQAGLDAAGIQYIKGYDAVDTIPGNGVPDSPNTAVMAADGVHLNIEGHRRLGELIWGFLQTPIANFAGNTTTGYAPMPVLFTDASTNTPTSWLWAFGDGTTSTSQNPIHTYNTAGSFVVSLTATNTAGSNTVSRSCITVNQLTPTVTWGNPSSITYGTVLSNTQLKATASVQGSFVYTPAAGTVLNAGTQTLRVVFTPTSSSYTTASKDVTISVNKETPVITWATQSILPGVALSNTQLCASTNVPGAFNYAQPLGSIIFTNYGGSSTLSCTFIPTDTGNYNVVSKTCKLTSAAMDMRQHQIETAAAAKIVSDTAKTTKHGYYLDPTPVDIGSKHPIDLGSRTPMKL